MTVGSVRGVLCVEENSIIEILPSLNYSWNQNYKFQQVNGLSSRTALTRLTCLKLNNILDFYLGSIIYKVIFVTDYDGEDRRNLVKMIIYIWQWFVFCGVNLNSIIRLNVCLMKLRTLDQGKDHKLVLKHFQIKL